MFGSSFLQTIFFVQKFNRPNIFISTVLFSYLLSFRALLFCSRLISGIDKSTRFGGVPLNPTTPPFRNRNTGTLVVFTLKVFLTYSNSFNTLMDSILALCSSSIYIFHKLLRGQWYSFCDKVKLFCLISTTL